MGLLLVKHLHPLLRLHCLLVCNNSTNNVVINKPAQCDITIESSHDEIINCCVCVFFALCKLKVAISDTAKQTD